MSLPTIIFCGDQSAPRKIAGLSVVDRLVVAAHRAGAPTITLVGSGSSQPLLRSEALGITVGVAANQESEFRGPLLVISDDAFAQAADLKRLMTQRGRLVDRDGNFLSVGVADKISTQSPEAQLTSLPPLRADGVARGVGHSASLELAERELWTSLSSSADGFVDRHFNRPVGRILSKILVHTDVSPNQVSVAATVLGLGAAALFARATYAASIAGALLLQISAIVDCVDGDLARILFKESRLGKWLDIVGDQVVHVAVFAAIGWGLYRTGGVNHALILTASAVLGVVISFVVIVGGERQSAQKNNARLQRLIDATTNRDFSVLLIVLALSNRLSWFLWMTAIGVHLFWLTALSLQFSGGRSAPVLNSKSESSA